MATISELTTGECLDLLRTTTVGRIGTVTPSGLVILPVSYVLVKEAIVFRTLPYGVIAEHAHDVDVAFEVDHLDEEQRTGWSVLATGPSRRIEDPQQVAEIRSGSDPVPWADEQRNLYFRIGWTGLTGRRIGS